MAKPGQGHEDATLTLHGNNPGGSSLPALGPDICYAVSAHRGGSVGSWPAAARARHDVDLVEQSSSGYAPVNSVCYGEQR